MSAAAVRQLLQGLTHLIYPSACLVCETPTPPDAGPFCAACRSALFDDLHPTCPRCAATLGPYSATRPNCPLCQKVRFAFAATVRLGFYDGRLKEVVLRMKNVSGEMLAEVIGEMWAEQAVARLAALRAAVVVPVPLHWTRRLRRGYNQSASVARGIAAKLGLPLRTDLLRRVRRTPRQAGREAADRLANVRGAFAAKADPNLRGRRVLLVDDVMTTGSTASEAARALRAAGAGRVVVAVLARSHPK